MKETSFNKKNFLVIAQDLRISGTSEGIVSRSFLGKLRKIFPDSQIDVVYIRNHQNDDRLDLLPVDDIQEYFVNNKNHFLIKFINIFYWRIRQISLNEKYLIYKYKRVISKIKFIKYDHIFIRSSGLGFENIRALEGLPVLKKSIINFHDPFPSYWNKGSGKKMNLLDLMKLKEMEGIIQEAKTCITPSSLLSEDLEFLYGSRKKFLVLPHQYDPEVFPVGEGAIKNNLNNRIILSYHGAIQFERNVDILLEAYAELIKENVTVKSRTEFHLRLRGNGVPDLREKYKNVNQIKILKPLNFAESSNEQRSLGDIFIILENCATHSNILVGKAPFLDSLNKPILSLSPIRSEMRRLIGNNKYLALCKNKRDIKKKLALLINESLVEGRPVKPFGDYFGEQNFQKHLKEVLKH